MKAKHYSLFEHNSNPSLKRRKESTSLNLRPLNDCVSLCASVRMPKSVESSKSACKKIKLKKLNKLETAAKQLNSAAVLGFKGINQFPVMQYTFI